MARWALNVDVAIEVDAEDEDEAKELAERFIDQAMVADMNGTSAAVTALLWGPETTTEDNDEPVTAAIDRLAVEGEALGL